MDAMIGKARLANVDGRRFQLRYFDTEAGREVRVSTRSLDKQQAGDVALMELMIRIGGVFKGRDAQRRCRWLRKNDHASAALDRLVKRGVCSSSWMHPSGGKGGRPSLAYVIAPGVAEMNFVDRARMASGSVADFRVIEPQKSVVYFVEAVGLDKVKIGTTTRIKSRLAAMQTGSPVRLELLGHLDGSTVTEADMHRRFEHLRLHGEWFLATTELRAFIENTT